MSVKFCDLLAQNDPIKAELGAVFDRVLANSTFVLGPEVARFEREFAAFCETDYCIGVSNGTAALQLTLLALGVGPHDEVITVAHTFMATAEAISAIGARPIFVDIDPVTYTLDPVRLAEVVTPQTKAIVVVHIYGQPADMDAIGVIAARYAVPVIEDACQAHGARYKGKRTGSLANAGCFSFYPSKNLGACGEGGAITTSNSDLAAKLRMLRDHGSVRKYEHDFSGYNLRLEGLQGGMLSVKLPLLDGWNAQRRERAARYDALFAGTGIVAPRQAAYAEHVYHLYVIVIDYNRDALRQALTERGIESGLHYPVPLHLQKAYTHLGYRAGDLPVTERIAAGHISLPMYAELPLAHVDAVAAVICEALAGQAVGT